MWGVAVWQQQVLYDANDANPVNPHLKLDSAKCLSPPTLCGQNPLPAGTPSTLGSPSTPPASLIVPNDPDPPTVDD
jgi:hypothetical protein